MIDGFVLWSGQCSDIDASVKYLNGIPRAFVRDKPVNGHDERCVFSTAIRELAAERDMFKIRFYELERSTGTK